MEHDELSQLFKKFETPGERPTENEIAKTSSFGKPNLNTLKKIAPYLIAITFLIFAFENATSSQPQAAPRASILALMPMVAVSKGEKIPTSALRVVGIDPKQLNKSQLQTLVLEHDLDGLADKIRSKKTLPPNKILFWKDLELETIQKSTTVPVVIYSKETP